MEKEVIAAILIISVFLVLLFLRTPIVFAIGFSTVVTIMYLDIPLMMVAQMMVKNVNTFILMAVPFFIIAGEIMSAGGIAKRIVAFANALVGWMRGGLAMVNCVDSMFFGGISGSSAADTAALGSVVIPMMVEQGYEKEFSTNLTMATSVQGILIPPSHNMVTYSLVAGSISVGRLFLGGFIPGILLGVSMMIYSYYVAVKKNYPVGDKFSFKILWKTFVDAAWGLGTIIIIIGGVTTGIFTATESAAIAVVWAIFVTFFIYREIPLKEIWSILGRALHTLGIVMILIGTSGAFAWVLSYLRVPAMIAGGILSVSKNPIVITLILQLIMLFLGTLLDMSAIILIATPILLPIAANIGFDPVHFGIVMMLNLGMGLLTPPVGSTLFIGSAISGIKIEVLSKTLLPFYGVMLLVLMLITFVPGIVMFLPNLLMPIK
ncbi:MAG: TRAP transporter large permease [Treponema sp.]|jgi:tripartite ATP-independent transporter DctM subunit|nr:TRAP transporter large permease [Treponema sp.]